MDKDYIEIMIQSLEKKIDILDELIQLNKQQSFLLQDSNLSPEEFEKNVDNKAVLIEELNRLDNGFEGIYSKLKEEFDKNKQQHAGQIAQMQTLIRMIMDKSNQVQTQEMRNNENVINKFANVRKQVKEVRKSQMVVKQYYETMTKQNNFSTSQFMDNKK